MEDSDQAQITINNDLSTQGSAKVNNNDDSCMPKIGNYQSFENLTSFDYCSTPKSQNVAPSHHCAQDLKTPLEMWMDEIRTSYFSECMTTLQSKTLTSDTCDKIKVLTHLTIKVIKTLNRNTYLIAKECDHIHRHMKMSCGKQMIQLVENLTLHMIQILSANGDESHDLTVYYQILKVLQMPPAIEHSSNFLLRTINFLACDFSRKIDKSLLGQIEILVGLLDCHESQAAIMIVLNGLMFTDLQPDHMGNLLARTGGIQIIVQLAETSRSCCVRISALRLLTTICCSPSSIKEFEKCDGFECLCALLEDDSKELREVKEVVTLVAQVSAPFMESKIIHLGQYVGRLVGSLTRLIARTTCPEMLLLSAAALANISHDTDSLLALMNFSSVSVLLNAILNLGPTACTFLKEQTVNLVYNMTQHSTCITHLCQQRAIPALLCFLNLDPTISSTSSLTAACSRIQHKAVVSLARMCHEREAVDQILQLQAVPKLVKLCKTGFERSRQNETALACLAALKRILADDIRKPQDIPNNCRSRTTQYRPIHSRV